MPNRKVNRKNKSESAYVQKKCKNKHSSHTNNNRIKQGYCGRLKWFEPMIKWEKKVEKKKMRIWYNKISLDESDNSIEIRSNISQNELENDNIDSHIDQYQDIPIWNCPICSYKNIEKHLFCCLCNHPYSRKSKEITISKYIQSPKNRKLKNNKKQKHVSINKISPDRIKDIISGKTGLPHNKIEINPLLNKYAMSRLLRKYYQYQNDISLVYMTQEIIPDDEYGYHPFFDGWQCQFCGKRNPKIYVFCERCFLEPRHDIITNINKPSKITDIDIYTKQSALNDPIIKFCGLRTLVYGYCEVYTLHKIHKDIIDLIATYYQMYKPDIPMSDDILPFNQHDLSQCNDFNIYVTKRNEMITCNSMSSLDKYIDNMSKQRRQHKGLYICLLFIKPDNEWPKYVSFQYLLPIYKVKFRKSGIQSWCHQFSDYNKIYNV